MIPEKYKNIIAALKNKTEANQTNWNKSSGADSFSLKYSEGMIEIDMWYDSNDQSNYADITLFNRVGEKIDYVQTSATGSPADFQLLKELHLTIKRKYYRVDYVLDSLLKVLNNKNNIIGIEENDDLPF